MRLNIYSQELLTDERPDMRPLETVQQKANTGLIYSAVRLFLHSSPRLHTDDDDDRSAITFWLPKSAIRRERFAKDLETLAAMVRAAPPETGLD